jgi:ribosomal-protein-alanine N-acetyltransferase
MPTPNFVMETANWLDLPALQRLERVCFDIDAWSILDLIGVLSIPDFIRLKASVEGQMAGFVAAEQRKNETRAWIVTIGVFPEYRRYGIARALMRACEEQIQLPVVRLCVRRSNNAAQHLYETSGYQRIDIWRHYYHSGEDALVYEKILHP